jgi:hypothetical protein
MNGPINQPLRAPATSRIAASLTLLLCVAINLVGALHGLIWL